MTSKFNIKNFEKYAMTRIDDILDALGIKFKNVGNKLVGPCPIHGGDNASAFNLYLNSTYATGYNICRTHQCQKVFLPTLTGFVRGVLSNEKGWRKPGDKTVSYDETLRFLLKLLDKQKIDFYIDDVEISKAKFIQKYLPKKEKIEQKEIRRIDWELPITFLLRGYGADLLRLYEVSYCSEGEMYGRIVFPIHDDSGKIIGYVGRADSAKCSQCRAYHVGDKCPGVAKWKNSSGIESSLYLYNLYRAQDEIERRREIILTEGPPDVLRLVQAGVLNAVAIFGTTLSDRQQILMQSLHIDDVIILTDNDEAGRTAANNIVKKIGRFYNCKIPFFSTQYKDVGEMPIAEIQKLFPR